MDIMCHGGKCCGMTHIQNMGYADPKVARAGAKSCNGIEGFCTHAYPGSVGGRYTAPEETQFDRLQRLVHIIEDRRSKGIIEVVLSTDCSQHRMWEKSMLELNFKLTNPGGTKNSNSGERLYVYHRYSGEVDRVPLPVKPNTTKKKVEG